jgi:GMP synthase (glutamine-hydrolysing)
MKEGAMPEKRVLILQHISENPACRVGDLLEENEIGYHLVHIGKDHLPDPSSYHALVVLGGSQHVHEKHIYPYTAHEETYLHQAIKQGVPFLGICQGGQLLAHAFGATVKRLPKVHVGFLRIHFTAAGREDPLFRGLPGQQPVFHWHEDCFLLPRGAVALAHLADGFNQALRYGQHAYGLQYHIELTADTLDTWLHDTSMKHEFIATYGSEAYRKVEREAVECFPQYMQQSSAVLRNFFRLSRLI